MTNQRSANFNLKNQNKRKNGFGLLTSEFEKEKKTCEIVKRAILKTNDHLFWRATSCIVIQGEGEIENLVFEKGKRDDKLGNKMEI